MTMEEALYVQGRGEGGAPLNTSALDVEGLFNRIALPRPVFVLGVLGYVSAIKPIGCGGWWRLASLVFWCGFRGLLLITLVSEFPTAPRAI